MSERPAGQRNRPIMPSASAKSAGAILSLIKQRAEVRLLQASRALIASSPAECCREPWRHKAKRRNSLARRPEQAVACPIDKETICVARARTHPGRGVRSYEKAWRTRHRHGSRSALSVGGEAICASSRTGGAPSALCAASRRRAKLIVPRAASISARNRGASPSAMQQAVPSRRRRAMRRSLCSARSRRYR